MRRGTLNQAVEIHVNNLTKENTTKNVKFPFLFTSIKKFFLPVVQKGPLYHMIKAALIKLAAILRELYFKGAFFRITLNFTS